MDGGFQNHRIVVTEFLMDGIEVDSNLGDYDWLERDDLRWI